MIELLSSGLGAALSLFGESERQKAERRQRKLLEEAKIDKGEEEAITSSINRSFNTQTMSSANSSAIGLDAILNADTVRGLNASTLLGQRSKAIADAKLGIVERNNQIDAQIAENPVNPTNIGNVVGGGLLGYQIGESIDKLTNDQLSNDVTKDYTSDNLGAIDNIFKKNKKYANEQLSTTSLFPSLLLK